MATNPDTLTTATTLRSHSQRLECVTDEALAILNIAEEADGDEARAFVQWLRDGYTINQQAAILGAACALVRPDYAARILDAWAEVATIVAGEEEEGPLDDGPMHTTLNAPYTTIHAAATGRR